MPGSDVRTKRGKAGEAEGTVRLKCQYCGKAFLCKRSSLAARMGICLVCFEKRVRFPQICQRP